jgi:hypothetical protein
MNYSLIFIEIKFMKRIFCALAVFLFFDCNRAAFKSKWTHEKAPSTYVVLFDGYYAS